MLLHWTRNSQSISAQQDLCVGHEGLRYLFKFILGWSRPEAVAGGWLAVNTGWEVVNCLLRQVMYQTACLPQGPLCVKLAVTPPRSPLGLTPSLLSRYHFFLPVRLFGDITFICVSCIVGCSLIGVLLSACTQYSRGKAITGRMHA